MKRLGLVRLGCVWVGCLVLLHWARSLPVMYFGVPFTGLELSLYGLLFPVLLVPLVLTWLRFPKRGE